MVREYEVNTQTLDSIVRQTIHGVVRGYQVCMLTTLQPCSCLCSPLYPLSTLCRWFACEKEEQEVCVLLVSLCLYQVLLCMWSSHCTSRDTLFRRQRYDISLWHLSLICQGKKCKTKKPDKPSAFSMLPQLRLSVLHSLYHWLLERHYFRKLSTLSTPQSALMSAWSITACRHLSKACLPQTCFHASS